MAVTQRDATVVGLLNYCYTSMCDDCWRDVQFRSRGGKLATQQSVNWKRVVPLLATLTVAGALLWGFFQQPPHLNRLGLFSLIDSGAPVVADAAGRCPFTAAPRAGVIALNGICGVTCGILFLRYGILSAVAPHLATDVVWHAASQVFQG